MVRDFFIVCGIFLLAVVLLGWMLFALDEVSCAKRYRSYGEVDYTVLGGCMVYHKDRWVPSETIREI